MNQAIKSSELTDIKLPLYYILTGLLFFVISQCIFLLGGKSILNTSIHVPYIWAAVHAFILGFAAMVAMGAMYQLVPVACQASIYSIKWGYIQYVLFTIGVFGITYSFLHFSAAFLMISGILTVLAITIFLFNMGLTLHNAPPSFIKNAVSQSLIYFAITVWIGLWMAFDFLNPSTALWHQKLLFIHITLGLNGWFALLIIGFSYKLIPMFSLSHHYESYSGRYSLWLINAGILISVFSILLSFTYVEYLGWASLFAGYILYMYQIRIILKHRLRKRLDLGLKVAIFAWLFTLLLIAIILLLSVIHPMNKPAMVYSILMGWIGLNILGFLYKIVPFLWWTHKYSEVIGHDHVPLLKDMINEKMGKWIFIFLISMIILNLVTMLNHLTMVFIVAQTMVIFISLLYLLQIVQVIFRRTKPHGI